MAAPFIEVLGQSVKNLAELNALLLSAKEDKTVIFIDEAAELDPSMQVALYMALDQRKIVVSGSKSGGSPITIPLGRLHALAGDDPRGGPAATIARSDAAGATVPVLLRTRNSLNSFAFAASGFGGLLMPKSCPRSPRGLVELLAWLSGCFNPVVVSARSLGEHTITIDHLRRACSLEQIDELGLGPTEQQYLEILSNGATRLNVLASMLGLPDQNSLRCCRKLSAPLGPHRQGRPRPANSDPERVGPLSQSVKLPSDS